MALHGLDEARGPHVGPALLDVGQALLAPALPEDHGPALGNGDERGPQRVLVLGVDQHEIGAVCVLEGVAHGCSSSLPGACRTPGGAGARPAPPVQASREGAPQPVSIRVWPAAPGAPHPVSAMGPATRGVVGRAWAAAVAPATPMTATAT